MQIHLLVPSQNQKSFSIHVPKDEKVSTFRKLVTNVVNVPEDSFLLIASGKIMLDKCLDRKPATLYSTYRVKDKTCVFVHLNFAPSEQKKRKAVRVKSEPGQKSKRAKLNIIRDINVISTPFENFLCHACKNDSKQRKCPECGCVKCLLKTGDPLICDQCDNYWHAECAGLTRMPTEQYWYCPDCYNDDHKAIIGKGDAMKVSNAPKPIINIRDNECVLVPKYHIGKMPGIYCGQSWAYRTSTSEWGVHRSSNYSVCGSMYTGAVSLVLANGAKEDRDDGYEFIMSGSGGGMRRKNCPSHTQIKQSQILTRSNRALAVTCDAPLNEIKGAKAHNWRKSQPIRVCRSSYLKKTHPKFAPDEGIRYDGLYKLVRYWPLIDKKTGFVIWKFLFRRDDQELPPWMTGGKALATRRGLRMIRIDDSLNEKLVKYVIPARVQRLMAIDTKNKRLWDEIRQMDFWSEYEFLHYLFDSVVTCSSNVCPKPIKDPITTPCGHICCIKCLAQSNSNQCFTCRTPIPPKAIKVNEKLTRILQALNWAYDTSNVHTSTSATQASSSTVPALDVESKQEPLLYPPVKKEFSQPSLSDFSTQKPKKDTVIPFAYYSNI